MVVFLADYRVKKRQGTPPLASVLDGASAIRYVRTHAERLGIDPDRIAAGGGSAGGHVAATTGMCDGFIEKESLLKLALGPMLWFCLIQFTIMVQMDMDMTV